MRLLTMLMDLVRGALIGIAEIIPGVSGGTIALIVGVYEDIIGSAGELVRGVVRAVADPLRGRGLTRARAHFREVRWGIVLPVAIGMLIAIVVASAVLAPLIEEHPVETRALFAGLIIASLIVPIRMVGRRWKAHEVVGAAIAAVAAFLLTSLPSADPVDPPLWLVMIAAAVAVCALVLPGVSGSFLLLTVGMYAPTLAAVNDRDLVYLGVFIIGAVLGLSLFVSGLQWLLEHRHGITLAAMTGLMIGALRALWPWQSDDNELLAPQGDVGLALAMFAVGIIVVALLIVIETALVKRRTAPTGRSVSSAAR
ncbi:DUF368 domain-containing protein [Okibacterium endophyticum]